MGCRAEWVLECAVQPVTAAVLSGTPSGVAGVLSALAGRGTMSLPWACAGRHGSAVGTVARLTRLELRDNTDRNEERSVATHFQPFADRRERAVGTGIKYNNHFARIAALLPGNNAYYV